MPSFEKKNCLSLVWRKRHNPSLKFDNLLLWTNEKRTELTITNDARFILHAFVSLRFRPRRIKAGTQPAQSPATSSDRDSLYIHLSAKLGHPGLSWRHTCTSFVANPRYVWCQVFWIGVLYIRYIKRLSFTWNFQALGLGQMEQYILFSDKNRTKYDADLYHLSTKWARVGWVVPSRFSLPVLRKRDDWTIVFEVLLDDMLIKSFWHGFLMFQLPTIHSMSSKVHGVRALGLQRYTSVPVHRDIFCRNTNIVYPWWKWIISWQQTTNYVNMHSYPIFFLDRLALKLLHFTH